MKPKLSPIFHSSKFEPISPPTSEYSPTPHIPTPETPTSTAYPSSNPSSTLQNPISPKRKSKHTFSSLNPFRIRASSTPQWSWPTAQCKTWLVAVLVEYCERDKQGAKMTADNVFATGGFGPSLYLMTEETWVRYLGSRDGVLVHGLLMGCKHKRGAVPRNVKAAY
ncbi:hypothetical protein BKA65DRAFT_513513 [Rhexocercosporidium sp. MPI-PUGE-AT-0058]|nr:hypothetical protein BKA65DRAFT_513513 [Rhexocercosporidium sp. MPI-PUGE-AT-0058]